MGRGEKREDGGKNLGPSLIGEGYTRIRGAPILPFNMVTHYVSEDFFIDGPQGSNRHYNIATAA